MLSPCVTFNDHEGSTKSYAYTREHYEPAVHADFIPFEREIKVEYKEGESLPVVMHDGSRIVLRKLDAHYDPTNRGAAANQIQERMKAGEYLTGLLFVESGQPEFHELNAHTGSAAQQHSLRTAFARLQGTGKNPRAIPLSHKKTGRPRAPGFLQLQSNGAITSDAGHRRRRGRDCHRRHHHHHHHRHRPRCAPAPH